MGFFANLKHKRAQKNARKQFELEQANWDADHALLEKMETVFTNASNGIDSVQNFLVNEKGEVVLFSAPAIFHETRRGPSQFVGGSSGVSIPVVAGIRFRVGAMRGTSLPGADSQADLDQGNVIVTTTRILFVGPMYTKEWEFSKLLGASALNDDSDYIFNVSNRQKSSGVRVQAHQGPEFNRVLALAITAAEAGVGVVLNELKSIRKQLTTSKPMLELPSPPTA
jgi:hypothetical protein